MVIRFYQQTTKYLGIHLDSILSGKYHCEILASKLKRATGMLSKVRHYVPKDELKSIYFAIFSLHNGCQIWGQGRGLHIENIYKLQIRALRTLRTLMLTQIHFMPGVIS